MKALRILVVSTSYPLREGSISGIFVKQLVSHLAMRAQVTVIMPGDDLYSPIINHVPEKLVACNYAPKKLQTLAHKPGGIPARLRKNRLSGLLAPLLVSSMMLNILFRARNYDIVHCNWAISGAMAGLLKWLIKTPIVTTLRGEDVKQHADMVNQLILKICLKYSAKVILVGGDMHIELGRQFPQYKHKLSTIYNGVDSVFLKPDIKTNDKSEKISSLRLITIGSLIPRKNVSFILAALALCDKRGLKFEYTIIGDGEEILELKATAEKELGNNQVKFFGELEPKKVADELSKSQIFLTSSLHEGRPNAVIEAMASGLCVLASDIPGHRELIKNTSAGRVFSLSKADNLADILCELVKDPSKIKLFGDKAREIVLSEGFTWNSCAENYYTLFQLLKRDGHIKKTE